MGHFSGFPANNVHIDNSSFSLYPPALSQATKNTPPDGQIRRGCFMPFLMSGYLTLHPGGSVILHLIAAVRIDIQRKMAVAWPNKSCTLLLSAPEARRTATLFVFHGVPSKMVSRMIANVSSSTVMRLIQISS